MIASGLEGILQEKQEADLPLQNKLHIERSELSSKIQRLKTFITMDPKFKELDWEHRDLLKHQLKAMFHYEEILIERLTLLNLNK